MTIRHALIALSIITCVAPLFAQRTITTIAGADHLFVGDGKPGGEATLGTINDVVIRPNGDIYFTDGDNGLLLRLDENNVLHIVAGTGKPGARGDGGQARQATLPRPTGLAIDRAGNIYVADTDEERRQTPTGVSIIPASRIRRVTPDGIITTIAGGGTNTSGENIPATEAALIAAADVTVDDSGNVYVVEGGRVRRIGPDGMIRTIAGNNEPFFGPPPADIGDGGPATAARMGPSALAFDIDGALLIADRANGRIRKVASNGTITSVLGGGRGPIDGGPPAQLDLLSPNGLAVAADGTKFVMSFWGLLRVPGDGSNVVQMTGREDRGPLDGRPATASMIFTGGNPQGIALDPHGNLFIADSRRYRLRRIGTDGIIHTFAGNGNYRVQGENWPAAMSQFNLPGKLTVGDGGHIYFIDSVNCVVREISPSRLVRTVAGNRSCVTTTINSQSEEIVPATAHGYGGLRGLATDPGGNWYASDASQIWRIAPDGRRYVYANTSNRPGFTRDGMPARESTLFGPGALAFDRNTASLYFVETQTHRVRKISPHGILTTVAGSGPEGPGPGGFTGDGGPATNAMLSRPSDITLDAAGNLYILDVGNRRIRKVTPDGTITTIAGNGTTGFAGDGGPAVDASFNFFGPRLEGALAVDRDGNLYVADSGNNRIRRITPGGMITTIAGDGESGFAGDGGPADGARLAGPAGLAFGSDGTLYVSDMHNNRIRAIR